MEKNVKENDFLIVDCHMKSTKEKKILLKLIRNLYIFKLFYLYIEEF